MQDRDPMESNLLNNLREEKSIRNIKLGQAEILEGGRKKIHETVLDINILRDLNFSTRSGKKRGGVLYRRKGGLRGKSRAS